MAQRGHHHANRLFYGDNLDILRDRQKIRDESVDLCYIDPPFNSKRNYNQIYNNIGKEDRAQAQAFTDTWTWDDLAIAGHGEILANAHGKFPVRLVDLIKGLTPVLGKGSLLAYLVSMALRVVEIHRVLKSKGSFYLHCDPTASHYLKLVLDTIFVANGGEFRNEIIWHYLKWSIEQRQFVHNHDVVLFYSKSDDPNRVFNTLFVERSPATKKRFGNAKIVSSHDSRGLRQPSQTEGESVGVAMDDVWDISRVPPIKQLYPTEKPSTLLQRIILASSNEGDVVLDAFCGCGTTVVVAEELKRRWIGIDITYQSISLVLRRLERGFGAKVLESIEVDGIPRDMESAVALAHKKDDRLRKEFEKWAVLSYTTNRAVINDKKGADAGIDGVAFFATGKDDNAKIVFQVKSGSVGRATIATLRGDMDREGAALACLITLEEPTGPMRAEAKGAGQYKHEEMARSYDRISIVPVREIVEDRKRLEIPMSLEVLAAAKRATDDGQHVLPIL
jgi:site-specific DNA-methyltransferase (adenine-specific)